PTSMLFPYTTLFRSLDPGMPVTILFGTESGNAELVAEELGTVLGQLPDVEVADLSSVSPSDLCPERFYLLVCSTYGDGDVPSSATRFYDDRRRPELGHSVL